MKVQTDKRAASPVDLVLIGCVKTKLEGRHKAKDLFTSPLFIGRRARAEDLGAPWFVLSAKFGLLAPDREIETYDVSLNDASTAERRVWSAKVLGQLKESFGSVAGKTVEVHAGGIASAGTGFTLSPGSMAIQWLKAPKPRTMPLPETS